MIKKQYLFPECYIFKQPYCDVCNLPLENKNMTLLSHPPIHVYVCPKCGKEYNFKENELQGEWKWRTI